MDVERVRAIIKKFAHVEETVQWGESLVFWVGDKAIGGRMFAVVRMEGQGKVVMSFSAGPERYAELIENEGLIPAPYAAHNYWVALERWDALEARDLAQLLADAHALTLAKLSKRTRAVLAMPAPERRRLVAQRREALLAAKAAESVAKKASPRRSNKPAGKSAAALEPAPAAASRRRKTERVPA
jgi:predicted DNA-binding protein (MmcQ/YjbR family)